MSINRFSRCGVLVLAGVLPFHCWIATHAATFHVALNGNNSNNGSQQNPWRTIDYAADRIAPGDTVIVGPGNYNEIVTPAVSGVTGNPITFYGGGIATNAGWTLNSRNHIRIIGFTVNLNNAGSDVISLSNSHFIEVWDCTLRGGNRQLIGQDTGGKVSSGNNCIFSGNYFVGASESRFLQIRGRDNIVEYNIGDGQNEDFMYWMGPRNIIRNNYAFNPNAASAGHVDFVQTGDEPLGADFSTIECNLYIDSETPASHHHFSNMENSALPNFTDILLRRNVAHRIGTLVHNIFDNVVNVYLVHESYVDANLRSGTYYAVWIENINARIVNSIAYNIWGANISNPQVWAFSSPNSAVHDYNLGYDPDGTVTFTGAFGSEANSLKNVNPAFVDYANDRFYLDSSSPAIGQAGALTRTTSSGSGRTFNVADAGYFRGDNPVINQYNGELVVGDIITVDNEVVQIEGISGNTITVVSNFTWAANAPVYLGPDSTPDIGAYPHLASGFDFNVNVSSHSNGQMIPAGSHVIEAIVNNPACVRRVGFFVNGLPVAFDNSPPFGFQWNASSLAQGSQHRIEARAYALYPSKELTKAHSINLVVGQPGDRPSPPENLRIVDSP